MQNYDNNSRNSKIFKVSRRIKTPSDKRKQSQNQSYKCLCNKCDVSNCQFRGEYEKLHKKQFDNREVMCGYDANKYIEKSLKEELP